MAGIELLLKGKAVLITGGSRGIGAETVRLFRAAGARVAFSYRQAGDAARALEQELGKRDFGMEAKEPRDQGARGPSHPTEGQRGEESFDITVGRLGSPGGLGGMSSGLTAARGRGEGILAAGAKAGLSWGSIPTTLEPAQVKEELKGTPLGWASRGSVGRLDYPTAHQPQEMKQPEQEAAEPEAAISEQEPEKPWCVAIEQELQTVSDGRVLVERALAALGRLDILVVNHGIWAAEDAPIEMMTEAQWRRTMGVNLDAVFGLVQGAAAVMQGQEKQGSGIRDQTRRSPRRPPLRMTAVELTRWGILC